MPDTVLGIWETSVNNRDKDPALLELSSSKGNWSINKKFNKKVNDTIY